MSIVGRVAPYSSNAMNQSPGWACCALLFKCLTLRSLCAICLWSGRREKEEEVTVVTMPPAQRPRRSYRSARQREKDSIGSRTVLDLVLVCDSMHDDYQSCIAKSRSHVVYSCRMRFPVPGHDSPAAAPGNTHARVPAVRPTDDDDRGDKPLVVEAR